jgi:hypothetical protein
MPSQYIEGIQLNKLLQTTTVACIAMLKTMILCTFRACLCQGETMPRQQIMVPCTGQLKGHCGFALCCAKVICREHACYKLQWYAQWGCCNMWNGCSVHVARAWSPLVASTPHCMPLFLRKSKPIKTKTCSMWYIIVFCLFLCPAHWCSTCQAGMSWRAKFSPI